MRIIRKHVIHAVFLMIVPAIFLSGSLDAAAQGMAACASVADHIPRSASETPRPVTVITRREIELSGAQNVRDTLSDRSVFNGFGLHRPAVAGGGRQVILVNGRRVSYSGFDHEAFPLSTVERIEIPGDSAAAPHEEIRDAGRDYSRGTWTPGGRMTQSMGAKAPFGRDARCEWTRGHARWVAMFNGGGHRG